MSVVASLAKAIAPALVARSVAASSAVLGARGFLRDGETGIFQKMARDQVAAGLIDGSTPVCLHAVASQLPALLNKNQGDPSRLAARFCLATDVALFDPKRLGLSARGADDITAAAADLADLHPPILTPSPAQRGRVDQLHHPHFLSRAAGQRQSPPILTPSPAQRGAAPSSLPLPRSGGGSGEGASLQGRRSHELFEEAEQFSLLHTAVACQLFQTHNPTLALCTAGLPEAAARRVLDPHRAPPDTEPVFERLRAAVLGDRLLSVIDGAAP